MINMIIASIGWFCFLVASSFEDNYHRSQYNHNFDHLVNFVTRLVAGLSIVLGCSIHLVPISFWIPITFGALLVCWGWIIFDMLHNAWAQENIFKHIGSGGIDKFFVFTWDDDALRVMWAFKITMASISAICFYFTITHYHLI